MRIRQAILLAMRQRSHRYQVTVPASDKSLLEGLIGPDDEALKTDDQPRLDDFTFTKEGPTYHAMVRKTVTRPWTLLNLCNALEGKVSKSALYGFFRHKNPSRLNSDAIQAIFDLLQLKVTVSPDDNHATIERLLQDEKRLLTEARGYYEEMKTAQAEARANATEMMRLTWEVEHLRAVCECYAGITGIPISDIDEGLGG